DFLDSDGETAPPVALISANLAQRWFGTDHVVGKVFGFGSEPSAEDWTIVGVVANNRPNGVRERAAEIFYVPVKQWKHEYPRYVAIRFSGAESTVRAGVSVALARV
ncbi:MAG TPA: ABC transporter permease, partial [Opitutaceae bacterium]|nr:ABC transporter permease [Opitutaceae bacterium]